MVEKTQRRVPATTVDAFITALEHPFKQEIIALRSIMLGIDPSICEEVKWNAPSFRTCEHFATMQLRGKDALQLILHLGARKRVLPPDAIVDPQQLLRWLGPDRAVVSFASVQDLANRRAALEAVVRQWLAHVQPQPK